MSANVNNLMTPQIKPDSYTYTKLWSAASATVVSKTISEFKELISEYDYISLVMVRSSDNPSILFISDQYNPVMSCTEVNAIISLWGMPNPFSSSGRSFTTLHIINGQQVGSLYIESENINLKANNPSAGYAYLYGLKAG